ncbi:hypothetical protein P7L79_25980 [Tistrella mobilis]|uniref:hypothetical protein n=1 Tax=Tistrella mobilis TaxID=171437 RepID=UPI0035580809
MRTASRDQTTDGRRLRGASLLLLALMLAPAALADEASAPQAATPRAPAHPAEEMQAVPDTGTDDQADPPAPSGRWMRIPVADGRLIFRAARYGVNNAPDIARHHQRADGEVDAEGAFWAPADEAEPMAGLYVGALAASGAQTRSPRFDDLFAFKDDEGPIRLAVEPLAVIPSRFGPLPVERFRVTERDCIGFLAPMEPGAYGYAAPPAIADDPAAPPPPPPAPEPALPPVPTAEAAPVPMPPTAVVAGFHCLEPGRRYDADLAALAVGSIGVVGEAVPPRTPLGRPVVVDLAVRALPDAGPADAAAPDGDGDGDPAADDGPPLGLWRGVAYVDGIGLGMRAGAKGQMLMLFAGPDAERDGARPTICRGQWELDSIAYEPPNIGSEWIDDPVDPIPLSGYWSMLCDGLFGDLLGPVEGRLQGRIPEKLLVEGTAPEGRRAVELMLPEFAPGP